MKYIFLAILSGIALQVTAQREGNGQANNQSVKNILLEQAFWKKSPDTNAVKAEIEKGADPLQMNAMNMDPITLSILASAPKETTLYLLKQNGADINKITHDGRTYLIWAASKGNTDVMDYLVSKGAKTSIKDEHGMSALNFAAAAGVQNLKTYDICINAGDNIKTDVNADGANALLIAAGADSTGKVVDYFISKGLDIKSKDANGLTLFDYAAKAGNIAMMKDLKTKGIAYSPDVVLLAAQGSRRGSAPVEVYQYLESLGLKLNVTDKAGNNALHYVVKRNGQANIIQYLISKGVDANLPNNEGNTPFLVAAAYNRDTAMIATLLPKDINQKNKKGATALALAVQSNAPEVVQYLINKGADVKTTDAKGSNLVTYLYEAYNPRQAKDFEPKLAILKQQGLDVTINPADGNTLYHLAVAKNDLNLLKRVQAYGGDVNAKNKEGLTPLHRAAMMSKDNAIMEYLVFIGASKEIKTSFNETAFDLAEENEVLSKDKISIDFLK